MDATVRAVQKVMPSVVNIATKNIVPVRDPFEQLYRQLWHRRPYDEYYSLGSGVVIDEAGYLLTNDHVVRRANQIAVRFGTGTNDYEATVVASDANSDVALLKLKPHYPGEKFHAIKFAPENDLLLGETVLALGNPLGLAGSVTRGILSSKSRSAPREGEPLTSRNWLQTDASINFGNSGGPLVNLRGELIGINVAMVNETSQGQPVQGIGFAIPIRDVETSLADIFPTDFVKSFWFGARVKVGTSPLAITSVEPRSPAGQAGLKSGDLVLAVDGKPPRSFIDFADLLASNADSDVSLSIQRNGKRSDFSVKLVPQQDVFNARMVRRKLGLNLDVLSPQEMASRYNINAPGAFLISGVQKGSPAAAANLQSGMLILGVDDETPADVTDLAKLLYGKKPGEQVRLEVGVWRRMGNLRVFQPVEVPLAPR